MEKKLKEKLIATHNDLEEMLDVAYELGYDKGTEDTDGAYRHALDDIQLGIKKYRYYKMIRKVILPLLNIKGEDKLDAKDKYNL